MNLGDLITYKYVIISKSKFFMITIFSLLSICSESQKRVVGGRSKKKNLRIERLIEGYLESNTRTT